MMNTQLFFIICIGMFIVGALSHILSWILSRIYKKKMNAMAELKKAEK